MILLGVNIDHAATLRQARYRHHGGSGGMVEPDPILIASAAEQAGADGITFHLREDRRHIQEHDVWRLRDTVATRLNLEMAVTPEMIDLALRVRPATVCLVPEQREEVTTEGGLNVTASRDRVRDCITAMKGAGIATSLFIDPDSGQVEAAGELGAELVELHTGAFALAEAGSEKQAAEWRRLREAAELGARGGLIVNAGHGINYHNVATIRTLPHLHEVNIGHAIISRALFTGIAEAVREMKRRLHVDA